MAVTYRLKDRALQRQLDAGSNGGFSKSLVETMRRLRTKPFNICFDYYSITHVPEESQRFSVCLRASDIEAVHEYDPHSWNSYPEVTPPEGAWMRIEVVNPECGYKAKFEDDRWVDGLGCVHFGGPAGRVVRFRPWDDDEEKDE